MKIVTTLLLLVMAQTAMADNNEILKQCLKEHDYKQENFHQFPFGPAAGCFFDRKQKIDEAKREELREFLREHPWYKGSNWKWEETAEYQCEKIYNNHIMNTVTICSKPFYLN